jgi:hypothetical protein
MAEVLECMLRKLKALSSNPSVATKKKSNSIMSSLPVGQMLIKRFYAL